VVETATLPFLDQQAVTLTASDAVTDRIAEHLPLRGLLHGPSVTNLWMRNVMLQLGGLSIAGSAHSPLRLELAPLPGVITLGFVEQGVARMTTDGQRVRLTPGNTALVIPSCDFQCESEPIVSVMIHASARELATTAAALAGSSGDGDASLRYHIHRPIVLDGSQDPRRPELLTSLRRTLGLLDQPALLEMHAFAALQLEDLLRRHLVLLLWPSLLTPQHSLTAETGRDTVLEQLLEWIDAHHHEPITLTELARRSGDSVRNLQYRFRRRVGCSPMQWLRQRRLQAAYADLQRSAAEESVAVIARRHGFHHLSGFAASFRREYGMLPSQLRRGARREVG
jgi:AraC-like DNA-binding protein